jgi:hypothetical protein
MKKSLFKTRPTIGILLLVLSVWNISFAGQNEDPRFRVFVLSERGGLHEPYVVAALKWLNDLAHEHNFALEVHEKADVINENFLANYQLFIQLNYPPYTWPAEAMTAFEKYIEEGTGGGGFGFHLAAYNDRESNWPWFLSFLGGGVFYRNNWPPMPAKLIVDDYCRSSMAGCL